MITIELKVSDLSRQIYRFPYTAKGMPEKPDIGTDLEEQTRNFRLIILDKDFFELYVHDDDNIELHIQNF